MSSIECMRCRRITLMPASWSGVDFCARCGVRLPHLADNVTPIASHPRYRRVRPLQLQQRVPSWLPPAA